MTDLGERFGENDFDPIDVDGRVVHCRLLVDVRPGDRIAVTWLSFDDGVRTQGISLRLRHRVKKGAKGRGGLLAGSGMEGPWFALWAGEDGPRAELEVQELKPDCRLAVSNFWRMPHGRIDEWFGNYGMLIEPEGPHTFLLRCNDGFSTPLDFDDQVVRIEILRADGTA